MELVATLIKNLLLTIIIECALIALILRRREAVLAGVLANLLTNPALNLVTIVLCGNLSLPYLPVVVPLELAAVAAEVWVYASLPGLSRVRAWLISFFLNAASFSTGLVLSAIR